MNLIGNIVGAYLVNKVAKNHLENYKKKSFQEKEVSPPRDLEKERIRAELKEYGLNTNRLSSSVQSLEELLTKKNVYYDLAIKQYLEKREDFIREKVNNHFEKNIQYLSKLSDLQATKNKIATLKENKINIKKLQNSIHENIINLTRNYEQEIDIKLENELGIKLAEIFNDKELASIVMNSRPGENNQATIELNEHKDELLEKKYLEQKQHEQYEIHQKQLEISQLIENGYKDSDRRFMLTQDIEKYFPTLYEKYDRGDSFEKYISSDETIYAAAFTEKAISAIKPEILKILKSFEKHNH